jgi:putative component of membrane protein insertase Oxa1/YidC/SpoIIIJ protein YidD
MKKMLLFFAIMYSSILFGQTGNINNEIVKASFETNYQTKTVKRKLLSFKKKRVKYNPLNYVGAGLLYVYQNIISEQLQTECAYVTSCSQYTKLSIQEYGFILGSLKGFNQLSECHPSAIYEHPELFIDGRKIINNLDAKD